MAIRAPNGVRATANPRRRRQRGFTLLSTAINFTIAGVVLTGGWMAYGAMKTQWRVANADRMMDQYGTAVMQELTNIASWSWGAYPMQGGQTTRWRFVVDDIVDERQEMRSWWYRRTSSNQGYSYLEYSSSPSSGVLFNGDQPNWVEQDGSSQYLWTGSRPGLYETRSFDQRDRMTVEGLSISYYPYTEFPVPAGENSGVQTLNRQMLLDVQLTLHYTYNAPTSMFGLYADRYVRERTFQTKICMRNWWVENNEYRNVVLGRSGYTTG